jgi:hypothetical protein
VLREGQVIKVVLNLKRGKVQPTGI